MYDVYKSMLKHFEKNLSLVDYKTRKFSILSLNNIFHKMLNHGCYMNAISLKIKLHQLQWILSILSSIQFAAESNKMEN